jgi:uncharacterized protein (TIGR02145 family)
MEKLKFFLFLFVFGFGQLIVSQTIRIGGIEISNADLPEKMTISEIRVYLQKHSEWRLPTIEELNLMYEKRSSISGIKYGWDTYASSGEENNYKRLNAPTNDYGYNWNGWTLSFGNGMWYAIQGDSKLCVRLVSTGKKENSNYQNLSSSQNNYLNCVSGDCDNGYGTMTFPASTGYRSFEGEWKKGNMDRYGNFVQCQNVNCRFKKGKLTMTDGSYYDGSFDNDGNGQYQGKGLLYYSDGTYKQGDFFKGVLNGNGQEKTSDGIVYKGRFINGVRQGECSLTYPDGKIVKGRFWEGKFISDADNITNAKFDNTITGNNPLNKKSYNTISNSGKEWMTENLNITIFRNGDLIPQAKSEQDIIDANINQTPIWCYFEFNPATETNYGKLYNWYAVNDPRGLMPLGYVIPSVAEWKSLNNYNYFQNGNGRAQLDQTEGKELGSGKINKHFFCKFENGPFKENKFDRVFGVPEDQYGFYWTTGSFRDSNNDRINVFTIIPKSNSYQIDNYCRKGSLVSVRGIKGDHNYYEGNWIGSSKSGNGTEFYGVTTNLTGYGTVYKGDKYIGLWKNGLQDGEGTIISSSGVSKIGLWRKGEFIGEWQLVDNRHKCFECNIKNSKSVKKTTSEIENEKKFAYSNKLGISNVELYCSSICEAKAERRRIAQEKERAKQSTSNSFNAFQCEKCGFVAHQQNEPTCSFGPDCTDRGSCHNWMRVQKDVQWQCDKCGFGAHQRDEPTCSFGPDCTDRGSCHNWKKSR